MTDDWRPLLDASTPFQALPEIVDRLVAAALGDFRDTLAADPDVTAADRAALIAQARPIVAAQTGALIEKAWWTFQPKM